MDADSKIEEIGQALRWQSNGKAVPITYAVIYWGNQQGEGGITKIIQCKSDVERGGWFNDNYGISIGGGKVEVSKLQSPGHKQRIYVSPNENDCQIFTAAYISAMGLTNPVVERDTSVLYAVVAFHEKETVMFFRLFLKKDENGKFVNEEVASVKLDGPGNFTFESAPTSTVKEMRIFASHNENDLSLVMSGIELGHVEKGE